VGGSVGGMGNPRPMKGECISASRGKAMWDERKGHAEAGVGESDRKPTTTASLRNSHRDSPHLILPKAKSRPVTRFDGMFANSGVHDGKGRHDTLRNSIGIPSRVPGQIVAASTH
jgi:hypothetical protein